MHTLSGKENKIVIILVGLPARGKTFLAKRLERYLSWLNYNAQLFNIGNYRRKVCGTKECNANFFDPNNEDALKLREKCAKMALDDLVNFLKNEGDVAVYDGTNTTKQRRKWVKEELES